MYKILVNLKIYLIINLNLWPPSYGKLLKFLEYYNQMCDYTKCVIKDMIFPKLVIIMIILTECEDSYSLYYNNLQRHS